MLVSQVDCPYTALQKDNKHTTYNEGPARGQASASPATPSADPT